MLAMQRWHGWFCLCVHGGSVGYRLRGRPLVGLQVPSSTFRALHPWSRQPAQVAARPVG